MTKRVCFLLAKQLDIDDLLDEINWCITIFRRDEHLPTWQNISKCTNGKCASANTYTYMTWIDIIHLLANNAIHISPKFHKIICLHLMGKRDSYNDASTANICAIHPTSHLRTMCVSPPHVWHESIRRYTHNQFNFENINNQVDQTQTPDVWCFWILQTYIDNGTHAANNNYWHISLVFIYACIVYVED